MPRKRHQGKIPTPAWEKDHGTIGNRLLGLSPQFYAMAGIIALAVIALGVVAYAVISDEIADRNRPGSTAVAVADRKFSLDYFTDRVDTWVQQNGGTGAITLQNASLAITSVQEQIIEEQLLLKFASEFGLAATEDEILTEMATRMNITKDDPNFTTRFQEELTRTGMTEEQFREIATAAVLRTKVTDKFKTDVPASAESIHYQQILVTTQAEADDIRTQLENGADFAALAKEKSLDGQTKENGGDAGWVPKGTLETSVEEHLFAQEVNKVTTYPTASNVYIYKVTEKSPDRAVDDEQKATLADKKYAEWAQGKRDSLTIKEFDQNNGDNVVYLIKRVWPEEASAAG